MVKLSSESSNMKCENCNNSHNGNYGSGRFCSNKCARCFSTKQKRLEINKKVSVKLQGRKGNNGNGFRDGFDDRRKILSNEDRIKAKQNYKKYIERKIKSTPFESLSKKVIKRLLIEDRGHQCESCKNTHWLTNSITLELEHIDGNKKNNNKANLLLLCPNCHSYTPTWRRKKKLVPVTGFEPVKEVPKTSVFSSYTIPA